MDAIVELARAGFGFDELRPGQLQAAAAALDSRGSGRALSGRGGVVSDRWGEGAVQRYEGDQVTVLFDEHGYRDLLVPLVIERRLLRART